MVESITFDMPRPSGEAGLVGCELDGCHLDYDLKSRLGEPLGETETVVRGVVEFLEWGWRWDTWAPAEFLVVVVAWLQPCRVLAWGVSAYVWVCV